MTPVTRANLAAIAVTAVGCLQMAGFLVDSRPMRGIGATSMVAPFPMVFSDVDGLETFASEFEITGVDASGALFRIPLTAERYSQLEGSYNRRNVYGAALAYAPRMPEPLWQAVFCFGLAQGGPLRRELGLPEGATNLAVVIRTRTRGRSDTWTLQPPCVE
ncbi:MAG TPA: hypothetical protein VIK52_05960 [Opitutaceae bacterium]